MFELVEAAAAEHRAAMFLEFTKAVIFEWSDAVSKLGYIAEHGSPPALWKRPDARA